jgi:glycosyltransferase involved in cell wall biosynthesis
LVVIWKLKNRKIGILIPPESSDKIAENILFLMKNKNLRKQLGNKAFQTFREYYTEERMLKEYIEEIYFFVRRKVFL